MIESGNGNEWQLVLLGSRNVAIFCQGRRVLKNPSAIFRSGEVSLYNL